jgi:hypothetical protein
MDYHALFQILIFIVFIIHIIVYAVQINSNFGWYLFSILLAFFLNMGLMYLPVLNKLQGQSSLIHNIVRYSMSAYMCGFGLAVDQLIENRNDQQFILLLVSSLLPYLFYFVWNINLFIKLKSNSIIGIRQFLIVEFVRLAIILGLIYIILFSGFDNLVFDKPNEPPQEKEVPETEQTANSIDIIYQGDYYASDVTHDGIINA